jgi:hypothetical protein
MHVTEVGTASSNYFADYCLQVECFNILFVTKGKMYMTLFTKSIVVTNKPVIGFKQKWIMGDSKFEITLDGWDLVWHKNSEGKYVLTATTGESTKIIIICTSADGGNHTNDPTHVYDQVDVVTLEFVKIVS